MRKVAFFSTLILLLLSVAPASYAHGSWGGGGGSWHRGGWGWHGGGGCCWGGGVFIGYGGYGGYGGYPYGYAPYYPPYYPAYPYYPPYPAYPAAAYPAAYPASYSGTVTPSARGATSPVDPATVRAIQAELQRAGYDVGGVDGRLGPRTKAAIRQYEQQNGLPVDGSPSRSLLDHMRSQPAG